MDSKQRFLYGKDDTNEIVGIEHSDSVATIYRRTDMGMEVEVHPSFLYKVYSGQPRTGCLRLDGGLHYDNVWSTKSWDEFRNTANEDRRFRNDAWTCWNPEEAYMIRTGVTTYNNLTLKDLVVLSFDIETTGLDAETDQVLMISTTILTSRGIKRHLLSRDKFYTQEAMIEAWEKIVQQADPDIITGHNIFGFDLPFILNKKSNLFIGRANQPVVVPKRTARFRRDATQFYDYKDVVAPGRSIVDTFFLSIKWDVGRKQPQYGLKPLIASLWNDLHGPIDTLGVANRSRQIVSAALIRYIEWGSEEWERAKQYCQDDADDSMLLFLHMIPPFFFLTQHLPKTLQQVINGGTGSLVNSFLLRHYLQDRHSIPKAQDVNRYEGGISIGNPGVYTNVFKMDVASLYPSLIRQFEVYDRDRDPRAGVLRMTELFTDERLKNKELGKNSQYHADLSAAQKIFINSIYGFMGAAGLNFNYVEGAAKVTQEGRNVLNQAIQYFT